MDNRKSNLRVRVLLPLLVLAALLPGCPKKLALKPAAGEITTRSYTVRTYGYRQSFMVKAAGKQLEKDFIRDLSWVQEFTKNFGLKIVGQSKDKDLSVPGGYVDAVIKIVGLSLPARITTIKYDPERELWMMFLVGDFWMIMRLEIKPVPGGSIVNLNSLGNVSPSAAMVVDSLQLARVAAERQDWGMAVIQARYDKSLDPKKLTEQGLRGEMFEKPFQAYEAETWANAPPEKAVKRGLDQDNFTAIINTGQIGGLLECLYSIDNRFRWDPEVEYANIKGDLITCTETSVKIAGVNWETDTFAVIKSEKIEDFLNFYITVSNIVAQLQLEGKAENGGTRIWLRLIVEPPAANMSNVMEAFMAIAGLPQWTKDLLLETSKRIASPS